MAFKLAELFVEVAAKGNLQQYVQQQKQQLQTFQAALNNGSFQKFAAQQMAVQKRMQELQDRAMEIAGLKEDQGLLAGMGIDPKVMQTMGAARREVTRMQRAFKALGGEMSEGMGFAGDMFRKSVSQKMEPSMRAIQKQLVEATIRMRGWSGASGTMFRMFVGADTALGKFRFRLEEIQKRMEGMNKAATVTFVAGAAAISGFVAAASPDAMNTLALSFKLLAAEIGTAFIPYMVQAIALTQRAAFWVESLSDGQKDAMAQTALWTVGLAGGAFALSKLWSAIMLVVGALSSLSQAGAALSGIGAGGFGLGPVAAMIAAITIDLKLLKDQFFDFFDSVNKFGTESVADLSAKIEAMFDRLKLAMAMATGNTNAAMEWGLKMAERAQAGGPVFPSAAWNKQNSLAGMMGNMGTGAARGAAGATGAGKISTDKPILSGVEMRPQVMGVADAWKNAQMQVKSPLQMKILEVNQQMLQKLIEGIEAQNRIEQNTRSPVK
jgi:hypothetical protein